MPELMTYALALVPLAIAGLLIWLYLRKSGGASGETRDKKAAYQGVVKKDWVATGRIDFATQEDAGADDADRPAEFRLMVEEGRIVESIAGNENLEIQWRLATLKEAKVVTAHYHKYLAEHALLKSISEEAPAPAPAVGSAARAAARVERAPPRARPRRARGAALAVDAVRCGEQAAGGAAGAAGAAHARGGGGNRRARRRPVLRSSRCPRTSRADPRGHGGRHAHRRSPPLPTHGRERRMRASPQRSRVSSRSCAVSSRAWMSASVVAGWLL